MELEAPYFWSLPQTPKFLGFWVLRFRSRVLRFRVLGASFSSFGCFVFDLGCFVFEFWVLRFRDLGVFVFEFWVLRFRDLGASCFGLRFRVLRFRNYHLDHLGYNITATLTKSCGHVIIYHSFLYPVISIFQRLFSESNRLKCKFHFFASCAHTYETWKQCQWISEDAHL